MAQDPFHIPQLPVLRHIVLPTQFALVKVPVVQGSMIPGKEDIKFNPWPENHIESFKHESERKAHSSDQHQWRIQDFPLGALISDAGAFR